MTLAEVIETLQTWIRNADDEYDREEMGRVAGLKEALHEIKKIDMCEDAISRVDAIHQCGFGMTSLLIADCLRRLPSVKPQESKTGWIPVSERLPLLRGLYKISDDVLITNGYENDMGYLVERKGKIFWHYYGGEYEVGIKDEDNDAIAWMPLPEPYKAESEDKE